MRNRIVIRAKIRWICFGWYCVHQHLAFSYKLLGPENPTTQMPNFPDTASSQDLFGCHIVKINPDQNVKSSDKNQTPLQQQGITQSAGCTVKLTLS